MRKSFLNKMGAEELFTDQEWVEKFWFLNNNIQKQRLRSCFHVYILRIKRAPNPNSWMNRYTAFILKAFFRSIIMIARPVQRYQCHKWLLFYALCKWFYLKQLTVHLKYTFLWALFIEMLINICRHQNVCHKYIKYSFSLWIALIFFLNWSQWLLSSEVRCSSKLIGYWLVNVLGCHVVFEASSLVHQLFKYSSKW